MAGKKSHEQQQRIIEKRVDTSNAGDHFDLRADLERSKHGLGPIPDAKAKTASDPDRPDELFHRGLNQKSSQHKRCGRP
jgi:hypothetical protein